MKGGAEFDNGRAERIEGLYAYSRLCGWALALAHAKSGEAARISGYCGRSSAIPDAIAKFALAYSEQNYRDYDALVAAAKQGRVPVAHGL